MLSLTQDSFTGAVLEADRPVVVDFTAAWCGPCRVMKPVLDELAGERDDLAFVQVDVDAQPELAARYGVLSMPTFLVFRGGDPIGRLVGARAKKRFVADVERALAG
jgi:thioredoxin 1